LSVSGVPMARRLQIAQLGNPILRSKAVEVKTPLPSEIQELVDDMLLTVAEVNGAGLAAPQVYEGKRIFVVSSRPSPRYPYAPEMEPTTVINPEIVDRSEEMEKDWEGCLSIPGVRALVPRHKIIRINYTSLEGVRTEEEYSGFVARVFQHEYDHLEGIAFLDRVETTKEVVMEREYLRIISAS
jgi:peptide deformylase